MKPFLIGAGSQLGVHVDGAALGARHLTESFREEETELLMQDPDFVKSHDPSDKRKNEKEIDRYNRRLYEIILEHIREGAFPILLGGDHSVAVASALASEKARGELGILWIDAHTDFNTFESTITGNIHGLPLAAITGYHCEELRNFHKGKTIDPHHAVVIGARAVDPEEWVNLAEAGVTVFTTEDLKTRGTVSVMEEAFRIASEGRRGVHVSYDLDLIDPAAAPGVSVPERDGVDETQAMEIVRYLIGEIERIHSFDLVELNPLRDVDGRTEKLALSILKEIEKAVLDKKDPI